MSLHFYWWSRLQMRHVLRNSQLLQMRWHCLQFTTLFRQRTRRGTMSYRTVNFRPSVQTSERTNKRRSGRSTEAPAPSPPTLAPWSPLGPRILDTLPRLQPPCSSHPPQAPSPLREPLPSTEGRKFPLFYRTLSPSGPLPCLNFSIFKKTAQCQ